ncbi:MAG: hypothetical protein MI743_14090 [Sneathiellales bacterium]|nr:hypothetical protein [Sneathiellales bacterium]
MRVRGAICCFAWRSQLDHWNDMVIETAAHFGWIILISPEAIPPLSWIWKAKKKGVRFHIATRAKLQHLTIETLLCFNGRFEWQKAVISRAEHVFFFETGPLYKSIIVDTGLGERSAYREALPSLLDKIETDHNWIHNYRDKHQTKYPEDQKEDILPEDYIAVPLQSGRDRQIINDSEVTVRGFVHEVTEAARRTGTRIVFKPHPRDFESDHMDWVLDQYLDGDQITRTNAEIGSFLEKSNFVCVINSGSSIDAFFRSRYVIQRGFSLHDKAGVSSFSRELKEAFENALNESREERTGRERAQRRYLTWLKNDYLYCYEKSVVPTSQGLMHHIEKLQSFLKEQSHAE